MFVLFCHVMSEPLFLKTSKDLQVAAGGPKVVFAHANNSIAAIQFNGSIMCICQELLHLFIVKEDQCLNTMVKMPSNTHTG